MESKHTKGVWEYHLARWAEEAPVAGFMIKCGKKQIASFNLNMNSAIISDDYMKLGDEFTVPHFTASEAQANAEHIVKCVNAHDELVKTLDEINSFLLVLPQLRMANKDGFDDCVNIDRVIEMSRKATLLLQAIEHEIQII